MTEMIMAIIKNCHSNRIYLGIDPAKEGAAIALQNGRVIAAFLWKPAKRSKKTVYNVQYYNLLQSKKSMIMLPRLSSIGEYIGNQFEKIDCLSLEDAYFKPNPKVTISVSKTAGMICSPIENKHDLDSHWVKASEWRHKVLGLNPFTKRNEAKLQSLKMMPVAIPNLSIVLHKLGNYDHITDASGVAYWAYQKKL